MQQFFTSEYVGKAHPDKLADLISDSILTTCLKEDENSRVACETMVKDNKVILGGEITTGADLNEEKINKVVKECIDRVGYKYEPEIYNFLGKQSPDIDLGTNDDVGGAGDQGIMFGYASSETPECVGLEFAIAKRIIRKMENDFSITGYGPDIKSQVTTVADCDEGDLDDKLAYRVLVSVQHKEDDKIEDISSYVERVVDSVLEELNIAKSEDYTLLVNPTGKFVIGGPFGDSGVTGRKIVVDQYGQDSRVGGGAFSGKDATKVDRSAAYMCRFLAKNIVASGLFHQCEIEISYAIGIAEPLSFNIITDTLFDSNGLKEIIDKHYKLTPKEIIKFLNLKKIDYSTVCESGHYGLGCEGFPWEQLDEAFMRDIRLKYGEDL